MAVDGAHLLEGETSCSLQVDGGGPEGLIGDQFVPSIQTGGHHSIPQQILVVYDAQFLE